MGNIRWGTKEKDLKVSPSHIHSYAYRNTLRNTHTKTHTSSSLTLCQINTHSAHRGIGICLKHAHVISSFLLFLLFFTVFYFFIFPKCPHFCSHIFWRTEPCERQSLLLKQIQTSIKQHMACLPVSDRWCRCTFQRDEPERHGTAGKTMRTEGKQDGALHLLNKTGTWSTMSGDQLNMTSTTPELDVQCNAVLTPSLVLWNHQWAAYTDMYSSHFLFINNENEQESTF